VFFLKEKCFVFEEKKTHEVFVKVHHTNDGTVICFEKFLAKMFPKLLEFNPK